MEPKTRALIEALLDGVTAHLATQARTGLSTAYSEYLLYSPIVLIASHLKWHVRCEYKLPRKKAGAGDNPRMDFVFEYKPKDIAVAMEVKWPRDPTKAFSVAGDVKKLKAAPAPNSRDWDARLILVAGPHEIRPGEDPVLRPRMSHASATLCCSRALGKGKKAWGTSIYEV